MNANILYGVIKSHSLIANLLNSQQIMSLTKTDNLKTFIKLLSGTPYANMFVETDVTSITLEKAFYCTFIKRIIDVIDVVPKNIAEFLKSYCIKFEILNLKRIIQGKFNDIPNSQIVESLIPIEPFDNINFKVLAEITSLEEVVARLAGTQFSILPEHIESCRKYDVIWPLELALNHKYATMVLKSVTKLPKEARVFVREIVGVETDIENLLIAIRQRSISQEILKLHKLEDLFPVRYRINLNIIEGLIKTESIKYFIEHLQFPYSKILAPIYEGNLFLIVTYLRRHIYEVARQRRLINDFGFNVIMAYIIFCEIEKDNLVGIAWGKAQNIPVDEILKYMIIPQ